MNRSALSIFLPLALLVLVIYGSYFWARRRTGRPSTTRPRRASSSGKRLARSVQAESASVAQFTAAQLRVSVAHLSKANAQWPEIMASLNPQNNAALRGELERIRGPHMFVPHLALQVIHHGCEEAVRANQNASAIAAITAARMSMEKVTRYGD